MSWQEELRKLDEELASGRLSADDYRVRRDQVLSSAVGQPDSEPSQPESNADSTQVIAPISPPSGTPSPSPTQDNSAERTQAVSQQWQQQQPQQPADPGRTEYVAPPQQPQVPYSPPGGFPQAGPASPAGGFPQATPSSPPGGFPQAPWHAPETDQSPPWGGGDLPPLSPGGGEAGWVQQGPESFDNKPKKGNGAKIGAIIAAVVVLAGIAVGAYFLWGKSSSTSADGGQAQTSQAPPPSPTAPPDPLAVAPDLPGTAQNFDQIKNFSQIPNLHYLTSAEASVYTSAGAGDTKFVARQLADGSRLLMIITQVSDPQSAGRAASDLLQIQIRNGAARYSNVPDNVYASAIDSKNGNPAQVRAHYAHDNVVVRIEVNNQDAQAAQADFTSILNSQLKALPANG
ncbi:flagellar basal body-associated FliL family protein [Amycolatopsis alkalitolerans]|uniref:DUF1707 domain-containing protein n=1 Tax=Amycolatopsis alkalitolerans TaxID=2547244 RepID=A0A5C4M645_9PSEU|nr:hypothetical protein [Amycolatopsis alkalitolerans]TNC27353.1 hypothetical protein FG385_09755 [Amycolatopsis alkalitolerans]